MAYLHRDGVKIYFEDDGEGTPVLLTHGFGASSAMWEGQVEALRERCRLVRWDMRGHGRTESPDDPSLYSQRATVADMAALLEHLGLERAVIAGHSLGGFMSLAFNVHHSARVLALILQGCGPGYRKAEPRARWNERAEARARSLEEGGLAALGGGAEVRVSVQGSAQGLAHAARGILSQVDASVIDSLPGISVPTLVIIGAGDKPFLDGSAYMASRIPGAEHVVVPDAGHGVNVDQPAVVNEAFAAFLARA